jgi:hypothetical protein
MFVADDQNQATEPTQVTAEGSAWLARRSSLLDRCLSPNQLSSTDTCSASLLVAVTGATLRPSVDNVAR